MYTDKQRVEDCIIPALFQGIAYSHIRSDASAKPSYSMMFEILNETINGFFAGITREKRIQLSRRLDRIVNKISRYLVKEKFDSRKSFLATSEWARALLESGALYIDKESRYWELLEDMGEVIQVKGYGEIPDFEKIDASAINHVPNIHKIAQEEGYFD